MTTLRRRSALAFFLVALALGGSTAARSARSAAIAANDTVVITGHGWGHGIGFPQWGAYGYAQHGYKYAWILAHYFPGTTLGTAPVAKVRVLLSGSAKSVDVTSPVPFKLKDGPGNSRALAPGTYTLKPDLKLVLKPGAQPTALKGPLTFLAGTEPLQLGPRRYRGSFRIDVTNGKLRTINVVDLESYLKGVVPAEMPHTWAIEALKGQAVVARSYALATRKTGQPFDLYPDTRSQMYLGVDHEYPSTSLAVEQTTGQVVLYQGKVATTYFSSSSGGRTAAIQDAWANAKPVPYLVSVPDPYDTISPYHNWGPYTYKLATLAKKLKVTGKVLDLASSANGSGRTVALVVTTQLGKLSLPAGAVRQMLGLRSAWFTIGSLSLNPPATALVYGGRKTLTGTARGYPKVVLQKRIGSAPWVTVGPLKLGQDGAVSTVVKPLQVTQYRLSSGSVTSAPVRVNVKPLVKLLPPQAGIVRGTTTPAIPGGFVEIQRLSGSAWSSVAGASVAADGSFQTQLELEPGNYRARYEPGHGLVVGISAVLKVLPA